MIKIRIKDLERFCDLKENQVVKGCDGKTFYTITRKGEYLIFKETS